MSFETTKHFLGDEIDLENTDTGELITVPGTVYRYLSSTMSNDKIFELILKESELEHMREVMYDSANRLFFGQSTKTDTPRTPCEASRSPLPCQRGEGARI